MRKPRAPHLVLSAAILLVPAMAATVWPSAAVARQKVKNPSGPYPADTLPTDQPSGAPRTLADALGMAYATNPVLTAERARLRATDENVPAALAGWRPTVTISASAGAGVGRFETAVPCSNGGTYQAECYRGGRVTAPVGFGNPNFLGRDAGATYTDAQKNNRGITSEQISVSQPLYRGGRTTAATHQAVNSVYAERARLISTEQQVFSDTVQAYVTFVQNQNLLALARANEQVLGDELRAINDRYRVGELTRTDVAQAEAALAQAIANRQTAEGNLETARASFVRQVGVPPPRDLADPQPLKLAVADAATAADLAIRNNPNVIAALFNEAQAKDTIDLQFSALAPQISLQGQFSQNTGSSINRQNTYGAQGTVNFTMPLYQGGAEYAAIRQARQNYQEAARQTQDARRVARQQAVQAYETLIAARAAIESSRIAVRSAEIALEGTEREALVGSATTQNVLIQQQNLLSAQITLVQNVSSVVNASYQLAAATGRLTARDLGLGVPLYDETAYHNAVRDRLWGTGDYAVQQPGR